MSRPAHLLTGRPYFFNRALQFIFPMPRPQPNIPERFRVARPTLLLDKFMTHFIKLGGISIILAVALIFIFIFSQIWPLFKGASVEPRDAFPVEQGDYVAIGSDEHMELPFFVTGDGRIFFKDLAHVEGLENRGFFEADTGLPTDIEVTAVRYNQRNSQVIIGTADGRFSVITIEYGVEHPRSGVRRVVADVSSTPLLRISPEPKRVLDIDYGDSSTNKLAVAILRDANNTTVGAVTLTQQRSLFGVGEVQVGNFYEITEFVSGTAERVLVNWEADTVLIDTDDGKVDYIQFRGGEFRLVQEFTPFADLPDAKIASMNFILGDVSVLFTNPDGIMRAWSIYRDPETNVRTWGHTKTFQDLPAGAEFYSQGLRNKAFLTGEGNLASLRYFTTEKIRWQDELPFTIAAAVLAPRYNGMLFLDDDSTLHRFQLRDPHPASGWRTYFGKIQYEGSHEATFTWQSTGGRDDFERKLSMVPLLIGTLKGTLYALIFALPIALLAAIYTSQFLKPEVKRIVKPTMEIMASLPSVVLGFLAALWLAPIVSNAVPSVVLAMTGITIAAVGFGWTWMHLPMSIRKNFKSGWEFIIILPVCALFAWIGWNLGFMTENIFFVVTDPDTGLRIGDFRLWFRDVTGLPFEQRNAFVVGFVMGFAVIPIIFTISEDALSNVPEAFRSGSLALGASRWQTAVRVVLPTAAAGIFSAVMIGFGRAVGETMIVVMATGNVPVTELNPFTGMRTLSANIAVELPEAPQFGTLYRTLFLGAMLLFLMTFFVNTVAEVMRQRLRERYRAVE